MVDSREQSSTRIVLKLCLEVKGTTDAAELEDDEQARDAFGQYIDSICMTGTDGQRYFRNLRLQDYNMWYEGGGVWKAEYEFSTQTPAFIEQGQETFQFDTTGGQQHITQALAHVADYPPSVNHNGAIGVTGQSVEGVDISVPAMKFSKTVSTPMVGITSNYVQTLYTLTGRTNNAPWSITTQGQTLNFAAGEVLFLGCNASQQTGEIAVFTFQFAASPNMTDIKIGELTGIAKKGWEYLWVEYEDDVAAGGNYYVKKPKAVHIEKVYRDGDFSLLGLT